MINGGLIDEKTRNRFLSQQLHIPIVELGHFDVDKSVLAMIPERIVREYNVLPILLLDVLTFQILPVDFDIYLAIILQKCGSVISSAFITISPSLKDTSLTLLYK